MRKKSHKHYKEEYIQQLQQEKKMMRIGFLVFFFG